MRKNFCILIALLLLLPGCTDKNAFEAGRLVFDAKFVLEGGVRVNLTSNLPDDFAVFMIVEAAPELGFEASWAGEARIFNGAGSFETIFTEPLPYRAVCIVSPALNEKYISQFTGKELPFAVDAGWQVKPLAGGAVQLSKVFKRAFGTQKEYETIVTGAYDELEKAVDSLKRELDRIDGIKKGDDFGLARFARLHRDKKDKFGLDFGFTSQYFPDTFEKIRKLEAQVYGHYLYILADHEGDSKEKARHKKSKKKAEDLISELKKEISAKKQVVP